MAGINKKVLDEAFDGFEKVIYDKTRKMLIKWCWDLVRASVKMRLEDPKAHNFTGNLLNSIVVCLYEDGVPRSAYYAAEEGNVRSAIMHKMTDRKKPYFFSKGDYDGKTSSFHASVHTDGGWGIDDARAFFNSFRPEGRNSFDIVVAYTVEYANFVQMQRNTTGILEMQGYALKTGATFLQITNAA